MCLSSVKETYDVPSDVIMSGEKEFIGSGKNLDFDSYPLHGERKVVFDTWLVAEHAVDKIQASDGREYIPGFHVYAPDQKLKKGRRVYFRKVTSKGIQDYKDIYIAQEIFVPSNPDAWPPLPPKQSTAPPTKAEDPKPTASGKKSVLERMKGKIVGKGGEA